MGEIITTHNAEGDTITFEQGGNVANIEALTASMMILAIGAVCLRLYARRLRKAYIGWDDYFSVAAVICIIAYSIMTFIGCVSGGLGQHMPINQTTDYPVLTHKLKITMIINYVAPPLGQLMIGFSKLSVILLYKRIFRSANQFWFPIVIWGMFGIVVVWMISFMFGTLFQCHPIHANWDAYGGTAEQCIYEVPLYYGLMYSDSLTDLMILLIPIPCVWALHMPFKQKLAVTGMFLLGTVTLIMSCLKLYYWYVAFQQLVNLDNDMTWVLGPTVWWPQIEASLGVVGGCLPLYKPIFDDCVPVVRLTSYLRDLSSPSTRGTNRRGLFDDSNMEKGTSGTAASGKAGSQLNDSINDEKANLS